MPYHLQSYPCPCKSNKSLMDCHAIEDPNERFLPRIVYNANRISNFQTERRTGKILSGSYYDSEARDFEQFISSRRKLTMMSIEKNLGWHKSNTLSDSDDNIKVDALFPEAIAFIPNKLDFSDEENSIIIGGGMYEISPHSWQNRSNTDVISNIKLNSPKHHISINSTNTHEYIINQDFVWAALERDLIAIQSFIVFDHEIAKFHL